MVVKMWKLKKHLIPQIKLHMIKSNYSNIDKMFSEVYLYKENGKEFVCFQTDDGDGSGDIAVMFYALNGAFYDTGQWSYIKQNGELIS